MSCATDQCLNYAFLCGGTHAKSIKPPSELFFNESTEAIFAQNQQRSALTYANEKIINFCETRNNLLCENSTQKDNK